MKRATHVCLFCLLSLGLLCCLSGCFSRKVAPEEILASYEAYAPMDEDANLAGIHVGDIEYRFEKVYIPILSASEILCQSEENTTATAARLRVFNAEDPAQELVVKIAVMHNQTTQAGQESTDEYHSTIAIGKDVRARYALVYFTGIGKADIESIETPALFFLVQLDKENSTLLTEAPRLAGSLLADSLEPSPPAE